MVGTAAARYVGVDSAAPALEFAARTLDGSGLDIDLRVQDMLDMVRTSDEQFDVIIASFALHHFHAAQKQAFLDVARERLAPGGEVLLVDVVRRDGETRDEYLTRYSQMVRTWPMDSDVQDRIIAHVTSFDFPEEVSTVDRWAPELGYEAIGFYRGDRTPRPVGGWGSTDRCVEVGVRVRLVVQCVVPPLLGQVREAGLGHGVHEDQAVGRLLGGSSLARGR